MLHRSINISKSNSFFLFGPRGTGKSSLLKTIFSDEEALTLDLLDPELADKLLAYPSQLSKIILGQENIRPWVIIDEIQKVPKLLDIVHKLIEEKNIKFALTGSSARKLKRGAANLLAGRAFIFHMHPLTSFEIGQSFDLARALEFGTLPKCWIYKESQDRRRFLKSYALTYIKEEIVSEQIVRNLQPFRRFLEAAAVSNTEVINYSNIAKDINSDPKSVSGYYEILEDTLLGFRLPSYHTSIRKRQKTAPKFYFFDTGVARSLAARIDYDLEPKSFEYGQLFENFIINEIRSGFSYLEKDIALSYIRVNDQQEIDLIIEAPGKPIFLCEIKSTANIDERHISNLETLGKDFPRNEKIIISNDPVRKKLGSCTALHWQEALNWLLKPS